MGASAATTTAATTATTTATSSSTASAGSSAPVPPDLQKIYPAAWPSPDGLPLNASYNWQLAGKPNRVLSAAEDPNAFWSGACDNWPNAPQSGWTGTQEVAFAPTKNFTTTGVAPGYDAPWANAGQMVMFADAKSAAAAYAAVVKLNDTCAPNGHYQRVASIPGGQSWAMSWIGSSPIQMMRTYAVQRGSVIMVLQLIERPGQAPTYDGGQDTATLNDIAGHLCAYAGAC
ncbi:hypothetical protein ABIA31_007420 [Catenulispora sp. MAP5-51]|uniref:hypothetical protein n=1 Tax=Catenulispora sp. MAP5-51 TaxID=3156298 RepID=UPI00351504CF